MHYVAGTLCIVQQTAGEEVHRSIVVAKQLIEIFSLHHIIYRHAMQGKSHLRLPDIYKISKLILTARAARRILSGQPKLFQDITVNGGVGLTLAALYLLAEVESVGHLDHPVETTVRHRVHHIVADINPPIVFSVGSRCAPMRPHAILHGSSQYSARHSSA